MAYNRNDFGKKRRQAKKSFYLAACTALICLLAVGTVYYRTSQTARNKQNHADNARAELPQSTPAGNSAIGGNFIADGNDLADVSEGTTSEEDSQAASAIVKPKKSASSGEAKREKKEKKAKKEVTKKDATQTPDSNSKERSDGTSLTFNEERGLAWPVKGEVIMKFSQKNTVFFKTLAQYKCNPAIEISAKEGSRVAASAAGTVTDISKNEETGTTVTTSIGGSYSVVYGQLKDVKVAEGQSIKEGEIIGKVAAPTKYFLEEGSNLYFQVTQNNEAVDPLLLLK